MLQPRARVTYTPTYGPARRAVVVAQVNDVGAYMVRTSDGRRIVVPSSQLRTDSAEKVKDTSA